MVKLTKIDAARRQLITAVRLLFSGDDIVSIYSLASNAWEVIDAICVQRNLHGLSHQTRSILTGKKDLKRDFVNVPYRNFFKHADIDPDNSIDLPKYKEVDFLITLAVADYLALLEKSPIEFQVFQLWFFALYPDTVAEPHVAEIIRTAQSEFPKIHEMERKDQLAMARESLQRALSDADVLADPRTEPHFQALGR